jgi:hypothetical protein
VASVSAVSKTVSEGLPPTGARIRPPPSVPPSRDATSLAAGPVEDEWLRDSLVAIAQLVKSLARGSFELATRIVPFDWWGAQLADRPSR